MNKIATVVALLAALYILAALIFNIPTTCCFAGVPLLVVALVVMVATKKRGGAK